MKPSTLLFFGALFFTASACRDDGESCEVDGKTYADGESWQCDCNHCQCDDGTVGSTLMSCEDGGSGGVGSGESGGSGAAGDSNDAAGGSGGVGGAGGAGDGGAGDGGAGDSDTSGCMGNDDCSASDYCHYDHDDVGTGCGETGQCVARPGACTREYAPVCGCDGETYSNECSAHAEGVTVSSDGEC